MQSSTGALLEIVVKITIDQKYPDDGAEYEILSIRSPKKIPREELSQEINWLQSHLEMGWGIGVDIWGDEPPNESGKYLVTGNMHGEWCGYECPEYEQEFDVQSARKL